MSEPFYIFPWSKPFLPGLKEFIAEKTCGQPGRCLVIVPNQRPWRYFSELYARDKRPGALPKMIPVAQLTSLWCASVTRAPYVMANPLEEAAILRECIAGLSDADPRLARHFADMDMAAFLPWGLKLASLIDDIFKQAVDPQDLQKLEGDVEPLAANLLGALGRIAKLYRQKLEANRPELMTAGLECKIAAEHASEIPVYIRPATERPVIIAGFSVLNGAENRLFHSLWQAGASICIHADMSVAARGACEPAMQPLCDWLARWKATAVSYGEDAVSSPEYSFYAAYDTHSQIRQLVDDLESDRKDAPGSSAAIVLPDAGLLMPVLHHMPMEDINISMGYPLKRAQLQSFLDDIMQLQLNGQQNGKYYWRDLTRLFGQPYLNVLVNSGETRLGNALWKLGNQIRRNQVKYVDLDALIAKAELAPEERAYLERSLAILIDDMASAQTPAELGSRLEAICNLLIEDGQKSWKRFPLDAEALSRLQNHVLPILLNNPLKDEKFSLAALYRLLDALLEQERIPFEAEPLVGTQLLGLLETRLLHFDDVYILDASDDRLPGSKGQDPLLPDSLRSLAGLPDAASRERIVGYNLYRLLAGAKRVRFYWAEGGAHSDSSSARRFRSRYVEQLIWKEEQKQGKLLKNGEGPLKSAQSMASLRRTAAESIRRSPQIDAAMNNLLAGRLSATLLNQYVACPAAFAMERLLRLSAPEEVNEGEDWAEAGVCIHETLADILEPYAGQALRLADIQHDAIKDAFEYEMEKMGMAETMPVDSWLIFGYAGLKNIENYFRNQKKETFIKALETSLTKTLRLNGRDYRFYGKLDRVDLRNGELIVLDYKTGTVRKPEEGVWRDRSFFEALDTYVASHATEFDSQGDDLLEQLRQKLPDIQLGIYLLLSDAANAAYVELKTSGKEVAFFDPATDGDLKDILACLRSAIGFILAHMQRAPEFRASGKKCDYCEFTAACRG